jgi:signal transduction histidine kinase
MEVGAPHEAVAAYRPIGQPLGWLWRSHAMARLMSHQGLTVVFGLVFGVLFVSLFALTTVSAVIVVLLVPIVLVTLTLADGVAHIERARAAALLGIIVASPHSPLPEETRWTTRLRIRMTRASSWKEVAYFAVVMPFLAIGCFAVLALWGAAIMLAAIPAYVSALPGGSADFGFAHVSLGAGAAIICGIGVLLLVFGAPLATIGVASLEGASVRFFLGPRRQDELALRLGEAERSRVAAVDSAESERRRIERDLHDGVQQRLVSLAMDLGRARERFAADPAGAGELVAGAHEDAKTALVELRELARGVHPAILTDRGLDAALSALVARYPIPVQIDVEVAERCPAAIESAAYFVVSEALTNIVKHARASRAHVTIVRHNESLSIAIDDDGAGGAVSTPGGGLAGLSDRVAGVGGWMHVVSPPGGPTSVMVELPCAS